MNVFELIIVGALPLLVLAISRLVGGLVGISPWIVTFPVIAVGCPLLFKSL